jgi:2-haloacid dehalogenase
MRYGYLTFDCYGTLIDWRTGIERELRSALGEVRLGGQDLLNAYLDAERREESGYKKYREVLRDSVLSISYALGKDVDAGSAARFAASVPRWPAFPDSGSFLREMGSRGYKRYILSNVDDDLLAATISNSGLEVDGFVTAEDVGSYKPKPGHWIEFLKRTGADKGAVLHVAQSIYHDIIPMQQFGIATAWVNRYAERFPPEASPSIVTDNLEELARTLD